MNFRYIYYLSIFIILFSCAAKENKKDTSEEDVEKTTIFKKSNSNKKINFSWR